MNQTEAEYARLCEAAEAAGAIAGSPPAPVGYTLIGTLTAVDALFHVGGFTLLPERVFYGWVLSKDGETIAVLRGTESVLEWTEDADAVPIYHKASGGHVHEGFYGIFSSLQLDGHDPVSMLLEGPVTVTGHSLGGALALIFGTNLAQYISVICKLFASPKAGDAIFANWAASRVAYTSYRYEPDIVPLLPPSPPYAFLPKTIVIPKNPLIPDNPADNHHCANYERLLTL